MTTKIQTAMRLALEARRFRDLADSEVHRTRRGHWHPPDLPCTGAARWATRAPPWCSAASSSGPPDSPSAPRSACPLLAAAQTAEGLADPQAGLLPGEVLEQVPDLPRLEQLPEPPPDRARDVLDRLAVIKLNGGLGTSMGLAGPKSLLQVKPGASFLDVLARQVLALRERYRARLPLVLMSSAATRDASLDALRRHNGLRTPGVPLDFLQGRKPKIRADDWLPVRWPAEPELQWCPPGHVDIYTALAASGTLDALLRAGLRYAFVSNSDNLGALPDARIAAWLAAGQVPFALEAVRGTAADRKGGRLARYHGRMVLRETAQVPGGDNSYTDVQRWGWYNTNDIWIDLHALRDLQAADPAAPALPLIINRKTADPRNLAFARDDRLPDAAFFVCQQHHPEAFWNPLFQRHPNRASLTAAVTLNVESLEDHAGFLRAFTGAPPSEDGCHYPLATAGSSRFRHARSRPASPDSASA